MSQQMDELIKGSDFGAIVLSPDYIKSQSCLYELKLAMSLDPEFRKGKLLPVLRVNCVLPRKIKNSNLMYIDLRDDTNEHQ